MFDSCKMVEKQSEAFHTFLWYFLPVQNIILLHIVLLKCQIAFLKFTNCDNQALVGCSCSFEAEILKIGQSSHKMYINNIQNFPESTTILNACTKSLETYWSHLVYVYSYIYTYQNIYIYTYTYLYGGIFWQHFFIYTNFVEHNRYFLPTSFHIAVLIFIVLYTYTHTYTSVCMFCYAAMWPVGLQGAKPTS